MAASSLRVEAEAENLLGSASLKREYRLYSAENWKTLSV